MPKKRKYLYQGQYLTPEEIAAAEALKTERVRSAMATFARLGALGIGANLLMNNAPFLAMGPTGRMTLYHGTPYPHLVLGGPTPGLRLSYAGRMRRLNMVLMKDEAARQIASEILKASPELKKGGVDHVMRLAIEIVNRADSAASLSDNYADTFVESIKKEVADFFTKALGRKPTERLASTESIRSLLRSRGLRIYAGVSLPNISSWGMHGNELTIAAKRAVEGTGGKLKFRRHPLYEITNVLLGGLPDVVYYDVGDWMRIRGFKREFVSGTAKEIAPKIEALLKKYPSHKALPVIEFVAGKQQLKTLKAFADFPGLGFVANLAGSMRRTIGSVLPNYAPGNDISFAADVPVENIRRVHVLMPEEKRIVVFENKSFRLPEGLPLGSRLKKMLPYAGYSALGAGILYWAITGKNPLGYLKDLGGLVKHRRKEKQAEGVSGAVNRWALSRAAKVALGLGVPAAIAAIPAAWYIKEAIIKPRGIVATTVSETARNLAEGIPLGGMLASSPIDTTVGVIASSPVRSQIYAGVPFVGPYILNRLILKKKRPSVGEVYLKFTLPGALAGAAMAAYPVYMASKYYPVHTAKLVEIFKNIRSGTGKILPWVPKKSGAARVLGYSAAGIGISAAAAAVGTLVLHKTQGGTASLTRKIYHRLTHKEPPPYMEDPEFVRAKRIYTVDPSRIPERVRKKVEPIVKGENPVKVYLSTVLFGT